MYTILEQQTFENGTVAVPPIQTREDRNEAYSVYYMTLAAAAISSVPMHSVTLLENTGREVEHQCFMHEQAEEE